MGPGGAAPDEPRAPASVARLAAVAGAWIALLHGLGPIGLRVVPRAWLASLTIETWGMLVQLVATAAGVALAVALLRRPARPLGLVAPRPLDAAAAALVAPAVFVAATWTALRFALPWLLDELATQGAGASQRNAGAFGQAVTRAPLLATLLWGALLAAASEELAFRGALWSAVHALVERVRRAAAPPSFGEAPAPAPAASRASAASVVATVVAAATFAWMHADMPGSVGIVRVVSTACLGLACGVARAATGSVLAAMVVHVVHNTLSIGLGRHWFAASEDALLGAIPDGVLGLAVAGAAAFGVVRAADAWRARARSILAEPE